MRKPGGRRDYGVRSVQLAIDILEAVAFSGEQLGVTQIAERLQLTKGSAYRHLQTLVERGYLAQNQTTAHYQVGPRGRILARHTMEPDLIEAADPPMRELRNSIGQTVVLSEMSPRGAVVLKAVAGPSPIEIGVRPGSELAFHASAQGKALLAFALEVLRERVLSKPLHQFTSKTVTKRHLLEAELQRTRARGFATAPEESILGINAIAAPVFDESANCTGTVAIVGSIQFVRRDPDPNAVKMLLEAGQQISRALGYRFPGLGSRRSKAAVGSGANAKNRVKVWRGRRPSR